MFTVSKVKAQQGLLRPKETVLAAVAALTWAWSARGGQVAVFASMAALPEAVQREGLISPTLVVLGHVVALSPLWPGPDGEAVHRASGEGAPPLSGPLVDVLAKAEQQLGKKQGDGAREGDGDLSLLL